MNQVDGEFKITIETHFLEENNEFEYWIQKKVYLNVSKLNRLMQKKIPSITIILYQDRKEFLRSINRKNAPDWLVAWVPSNNMSIIYIFVDFTNKNIDRVTYSSILLHEMSHLYINALNPKLPNWTKEGLAVYIAKQIYRDKISLGDWRLITGKGHPFSGIPWDVAASKDGYTIAGLLIHFFIKKFGWQSFKNALVSFNGGESFVSFFVKYFKISEKKLLNEFHSLYIK